MPPSSNHLLLPPHTPRLVMLPRLRRSCLLPLHPTTVHRPSTVPSCTLLRLHRIRTPASSTLSTVLTPFRMARRLIAPISPMGTVSHQPTVFPHLPRLVLHKRFSWILIVHSRLLALTMVLSIIHSPLMPLTMTLPPLPCSSQHDLLRLALLFKIWCELILLVNPSKSVVWSVTLL